ncbi:MAG: adenosylcobinamide-GDP ribazoletransferase [Solirubrobacteraceae bacterium]|nr:adenosylcobinamide-GDP ribazoletransferase [Solirubrobacteraceae bacterium]
MLADARTALAFLTRLPVADDRVLDGRGMSRAAAWFPVVGLLVGAVVGGTRLLGDLVLPAGPSTVLALLAGILLTGALHEDGLADIADGIGAHVPRERKLEILRDSRVGTYGAIAAVLPLLFAYTCLVGLGGDDVLAAAICAHTLARWSILPHSRLAGPARADGSGALLRVGSPVLVLSTAFTGAVVFVAAGDPVDGAVLLGLATVMTLAAGLAFARALGGLTGDSYGAVSKLVELAAYGTVAALWIG